MEIKQASFVVSNTQVAKCPTHKLPEYAFIGRSNVGKSSLINMLTNHKGLAKTRENTADQPFPYQQRVVLGRPTWLWLCESIQAIQKNLPTVYHRLFQKASRACQCLCLGGYTSRASENRFRVHAVAG